MTDSPKLSRVRGELADKGYSTMSAARDPGAVGARASVCTRRRARLFRPQDGGPAAQRQVVRRTASRPAAKRRQLSSSWPRARRPAAVSR